ncbi:MAG: acyl-CoA dehydrogenase, partial [Myxococcales bacterium]|nr:acyl-CoA dehydrogenase [Myxococcales bacterium]
MNPNAPIPLDVLTEEEKMLRDTVARFAATKIRPRVMEMDEQAKMAPEVIRECFELGLMAVAVPGAYGGGEMSFFSTVLVIEELAKVDPSVSVMVDVQNTLVENVFLNWGTDEQRQRYLPRLVQDTVGCYCLSEPVSGSDAFALKTRAQDKGDHWQLDGSKLWITNGGEAGIFVVFATVDPSAGYRGITAFIVERDFPGFTVGKKENKLGIRASSTVPLTFEACRVPKANVIGEVGKGYKIAIETLNEGRIGIGAQMIGLAQGAFDQAMRHMLEREQFGKPIAAQQGLQWMIADMETRTCAARELLYRVGHMIDAGSSVPAATLTRYSAMSKLICTDVAMDVTTDAVQLLGGYGYVQEYPVERMMRDAKITQIYEGTNQVQRLVIARNLLNELKLT